MPPLMPETSPAAAPQRPPSARAGALGRVVAPSGPFDEELFDRGLARLPEFDWQVPSGLRARQHRFFAGTDAARLVELQAALDCPDARIVLAARGGYGLGRIAHQLDWSGFASHPKWIVGFSDVTVLHHACLGAGFASLHAHNATTLASAREEDVEALRSLLAGEASGPWKDLVPLVPGRAEGPLAGGNLTVLAMEAVAGRLRLPSGALLVLEDVSETSYRVDRMLDALLRGGHLDRIGGLIFGDFTDCSEGRFGVPIELVLEEAAARLGRPAVRGFPAGHGERHRPWVHGAPGRLDAAAGQLSTD